MPTLGYFSETPIPSAITQRPQTEAGENPAPPQVLFRARGDAPGTCVPQGVRATPASSARVGDAVESPPPPL